jgi:hypothetical protein
MDILSGEWGYSSHSHGVSLETQAAFAARQLLSNLLRGIPLSIWYDWKNDGEDPNENEHNFGTVLPDLTPKPAYIALQILTRQLSGYHIANRVAITNTQDYVLVCTNAARESKLAVWTTGEPHSVSLAITPSDARFTGITGNGEVFMPKVESGRLQIDLAPSPKYVTLGKAQVQ